MSPPHQDAGFLNADASVGLGASEVGLMERKDASNSDMYIELAALERSQRMEAGLRLGVSLPEKDYHRFVDLLVVTLEDGTLDITGWNRVAIRAALVVCSERDLSISFKNGDRVTIPITYPKEGPLLDLFVESIFTGVWG
jgi:hypothetical protein